ncbi:MAG TPA: NADH-quinone oxidoreductase subunit C [Pseudonocardia sp.]|jgi:Ni,Fe-hydrogenase III large subunit/Ni,Fe-hydrogenase III component G|uniref:hydrogenase large subunit n=1 Tax=Pseudonocardia sp. TaxID=60912 RepID=UPI002B4ACECB|nr:NADH-quinone oxidoreductase subunit C [Pseudonocardia sp.]HLU54815.1 NADH-quinone oxidoreductase subunit C [Pseudonocardia sp.]
MTAVTPHPTLRPNELPDRAAELLEGGARLALVAGHDDRPAGGGLRAVYLFTGPDVGARTELHVPVDPDEPHLPSLAGLSFPAGRFEREMRDLFGIVPVGHPLPRRLVRHFHWPRGWFPMLSDAGAPPEFGDVDGPFPFREVEGAGVYEIPVGPVHAGMIGPGHFRFSVVGETILKLKARLWFVHRGLEKLVEGRLPADALPVAERVSGDTTVGHALAFCQAVEDATGIAVDEDVRRLRMVVLELERLYNHVADIGALCNDVGHGVLNAHALRIRERLLRLNDQVTGHRLLRGAVGIGTATVLRLPDPDELVDIARDVDEVVTLALDHSVVRDRFAGTAVLTREQAADLGTLGYVARASGLQVDARHDHPTLSAAFSRPEHRHTGGDVLARFSVRAEEVAASVDMIAALVSHLGGVPAGRRPEAGSGAAGSGVGIVEGWRGTIVHRVELAVDGTVARLKVVDPSFFNWPALPVALADTIVPDFPLVNKSFNLSYAGNDL